MNYVKERIGYIREISRERIGRIYPRDEAGPRGYKTKAETETRR
ncbi:MAG: hypothetical protein ABWJ42_04270 [Sulfolobales archaeon]